MKINEIVEANGRIKQGLKDVGRGLSGIGKGVGVGIMKAFDKYAGGKGEVGVKGVDYGTPDEKRIELAKRVDALSNFIKVQSRKGKLPTEQELVTYHINSGYSVSAARGMAQEDFETMQDIKTNLKLDHPDWTDAQLNTETKKQFYMGVKAALAQPIPVSKQQTSVASKLAKDLTAPPGEESFAQTQPTASEIVEKIRAVSGDPLVYQYGKQQYHLNGRGNWAKFPGEKEVPQTVAALLNQAADRDGY